MILANQGRYDLDSQKVDVNGPVRVVGPGRLPARDPRCPRRPQEPPAGELGPGRGPNAARPVPGGHAPGRSGEPDRRARRRGSLENRARGGQMRVMRAFGTILALALTTASRAPSPPRRSPSRSRSSRSRRSRATTAMRRSTSAPTGSKSRTAPTARSSPATSMSRQAELTLDAARLTVAYSSSGGVQIRRLDAAGGVHGAKPVRDRQGRVRGLRHSTAG